jgi:two-component system alkaline phosphatase synthesis response regulator PhoP
MIEKNEMLSKVPKQLDYVEFGKNKIDFNGLTCINFKGENFTLTKKEGMLLRLLIENKNEVVTREKILQTVWGYQVYPNTRTVDNFILNFRKYFETDSRNPVYFQSIRGVGYKFTLS